MAMSDAQRLQLFDHYKTHLGEPLAEALMTTVPPFDWYEIATKTDLARLETATNARFDHLETATNARFDHLETATNAGFDHLETVMTERFATAAADTRSAIAGLEVEIERINSAVSATIVSQTRWTLGYVTTVCGIVVALAKWWL